MLEYPFYSKTRIREFLDKLDAAPRKKWGQNFLIDPNIVDFIIRSIDTNLLEQVDLIAEIGPGLGALTHRIPELAQDKEIYLFEIDPVLIENFRENWDLKTYRMNLVQGDVLKNLNVLDGKKTFTFGNLPYYISTEIITGLLKSNSQLRGGIFMLQKEFAERIEKGNSSLSIFVSVFGKWKLKKMVGANCFFPAPKASSALLSFEAFEKPRLNEKEIITLEKILRAFFWGKRKTVQHIIKNSPFFNESESEALSRAWKKIMSSNAQERPESIPFESYYDLAKEMNS